ncbi:adenylate/guanylate cyclase domain-containing protein [Turneriella parva]|uniref:Adenylate cyclase n=1 Tax=Turneriella parva (strain ATCC BAA-1111 / DSM 21527 / NCTC 11395 / H) TaxID=869212 RepID=I4B7Z7_TURPD|nr:adenylate/guanylate cyclase domain-containing protein [Turneriella parva]AFM13404.1 adenylate/guanylate cyclase [Turneriella parva DSM 21527]
MKLLAPKSWPLFWPIPIEHYDHVKNILTRELFWNVRLALSGLGIAIALYYWLLSRETSLAGQLNMIVTQGLATAAILAYFIFGENLVSPIRLRMVVASALAATSGAVLGLGLYLQLPLVRDFYSLTTIFTMIVGVTGAASFTFTVSPLTFLCFTLPFALPAFVWLWRSAPGIAGQVLIAMVLPYCTSIFFLVLREYRRRVNLILTELNLKREQERSESLLLNILPFDTAQELKHLGKAVPVEYEKVTVAFTDFVGFTRIAEKLSPRDLIDELDRCFSYFDQVTEKYGLEKLKTIGDSFMCAGGLPRKNTTHAIDCALAALEIQAFMNQMKQIKHNQGLDYWELRLGMHTGPLVAGVVGEKKFAYDVWGDTVNTASRMESSGTAGAINISRPLYEELRFLFTCEFRGTVNAKNKGDLEMYYLRGIRRKFSVNGEGRVPNDRFREIYSRIERGAKLVPRAGRKTTLST